jgi:hypothetical protein
VPIVIAAVIVVGVLCVLDLLLTFGVIRRLKEHTAMLAERGSGSLAPPVIGLAEGERPGAFSATTADGQRVDEGTPLRLVAFLSTACSICPERVPPLLKYLATHHIDRASALAVVLGHDGEQAPYLESLAGAAQICVEHDEGDLSRAFKVAGYPAFCLLSADGTARRGRHGGRPSASSTACIIPAPGWCGPSWAGERGPLIGRSRPRLRSGYRRRRPGRARLPCPTKRSRPRRIWPRRNRRWSCSPTACTR